MCSIITFGLQQLFPSCMSYFLGDEEFKMTQGEKLDLSSINHIISIITYILYLLHKKLHVLHVVSGERHLRNT